MENSFSCKKNTRDENSVVYVLLPICVESKHDVFFNVLKNVVHRVGRTRLSDHFLDNAFKSGMVTENFVIDEDDILVNWKICDSKLAGIGQSTLLGLWSTVNCPLFGKIFYHDTWQAPQGNLVKVQSKNGTKSLAAAEINEIIFHKMKCHLIELNVCESTLLNLKHFVTVPISEIEVGKGLQITKQMKSFDVKNDFAGKCWAALKRGRWLANSEVRNNFL